MHGIRILFDAAREHSMIRCAPSEIADPPTGGEHGIFMIPR
jgi:hypothetical protein